ncbi:MAG: hypothetical protein GYB35_08710 [Algicola sp.]|nr:hypothetical protein [Algicola sp.]
MKTTLLKLCCFVFVNATFFGCPEKTQEEYSENLSWDFCETDCAVDCNEDYLYDTNDGSAHFVVPIPKGATFSSKKVVDGGKTVEITFSNSNYTGTIVNYPVTFAKGKLAKIKGGKLTVKVAFNDYECGIGPKATRNKGSVLQGHPIDETCHCK